MFLRTTANRNKFSWIIKPKTPSDGTLLGRTSEEVFVVSSFCCWCSSFHFWSSFYCHLSIFFIHILLFDIIPHPSVDYRRGFYTPFYTFSPAHRRVIRDTFIFNHSVIFLPRALRFWAGVFYPQAFFTLRSFTDSFDSTCIYQDLPGSRQFFLKACRASYWSSKHRSCPSVCLIYSNPQKIYTGRFYLRVRAA